MSVQDSISPDTNTYSWIGTLIKEILLSSEI